MPLDVQRIQALCFDVDGTLSDTDDYLVQRLSQLLHSLQWLIPNRDAQRLARRLVMRGETPVNAFWAWSDKVGLDEYLAIIRDFINHHGFQGKRNFLIIPGVREALITLSKRYPLSVVSTRDRYSTHAFLEQFNLLSLFQCVATAHTCKHTKPYPDQLYWVAEKMGVAIHNCLMIGDTTIDILAGKAAGAQTVGVLCGFGEEAELNQTGANALLPSTADLPTVLTMSER
ncbi:MAG: HAD family hydrolase [Chloroflexota bacterium]